MKKIDYRKKTVVRIRNVELVRRYKIEKWSMEELAWFYGITRQAIYRIIRKDEKNS